MTIQEQYENLEKTVRGYNPAADFQHIRAAFEFAAEAHKDQKRKSGEPYIIHPLAVAQIVAEELRLDSESIEAALLHDVIEDTAATHEQVSKLFSPTIADLVEGVSKLTRIQYATKEDEQMENLRKMLIAMSQGHPGDPHQDLRPAAQHAHHGVPVSRQAEAEVSGDHGDLRPHRPPAGHAAHQVGAGGPVPKISGPHRLRGDRLQAGGQAPRSTRTSCAASRSRSTTG